MPGELLNILMYNIATYTCANVEKMANSQVRLDARSDYSVDSLLLNSLLYFVSCLEVLALGHGLDCRCMHEAGPDSWSDYV